jgi:hypothetical protein
MSMVVRLWTWAVWIVVLASRALSGAELDASAPPAPRSGFVLTGQAGFGTPTGDLGLLVGWHAPARWSAEAGYGLGLTGHQLTLMGRFVGPGRRRITVATGPSLALRGEGVGLPIEHRLDIDTAGKVYYASWWNTEVGLEVGDAGRGRGFVRFSLGAMVRLAESMSPLCEGVEIGRDDTNPPNDGCDPPHFAPAPEFARDKASAYLGVALGVRF